MVLNQTILEKENRLFDLMTETNPSFEEMENLIQEGVDINCMNQVGLTPLLQLLATNSNEKDNLTDVIRILIEHGAEVNATDLDGYTALHYLCWKYQNDNLIDVVRLLIESKINLNSRDHRGSTAFLFLCRFYDKENLIDIIKLMIGNGVDINSKGKDGWSALLILCAIYPRGNLIDLVRLFVENGVDTNSKTNDGWNALHYLCRNYKQDNLMEIIQILFQQGQVDVISNGHDARSILRGNYAHGSLNDILKVLDEKIIA